LQELHEWRAEMRSELGDVSSLLRAAMAAQWACLLAVVACGFAVMLAVAQQL